MVWIVQDSNCDKENKSNAVQTSSGSLSNRVMGNGSCFPGG